MRCVVAAEPGSALKLHYEREERALPMMRRTKISQAGVRLAANLLVECSRETRFTDPGLAREQHHLALTSFGPLPPTQQQLDFLFAADKRREGGGVQRLKSAVDCAFAHYSPGAHRLREALSLNSAEILVLEETAAQPARTRRNDNTVWRSERLQPRGQIWCFTDNATLPHVTGADQITDNHKPGGDADAGPQSLRYLEPPDRLNQRKTSPNRTLGTVFLRARVPEIGEYPVAHVVRDEPLEAGDHLCCAFMIGANNFPQILGIKARRKRGRSYKIAKQHSEFAGARLHQSGGWRVVPSSAADVRPTAGRPAPQSPQNFLPRFSLPQAGTESAIAHRSPRRIFCLPDSHRHTSDSSSNPPTCARW